MEPKEAKAYRQAADLICELSKSMRGYKVAATLLLIATILHAMARDEKTVLSEKDLISTLGE